MKALEMLYRDKKWIEEECDISKIPIERVQTMIKDLVEINEAISELEALQQTKSCSTCNHLYEEDIDFNTHCMVHEEESVSLRNTDIKSFYCNNYEKEQ